MVFLLFASFQCSATAAAHEWQFAREAHSNSDLGASSVRAKRDDDKGQEAVHVHARRNRLVTDQVTEDGKT